MIWLSSHRSTQWAAAKMSGVNPSIQLASFSWKQKTNYVWCHHIQIILPRQNTKCSLALCFFLTNIYITYIKIVRIRSWGWFLASSPGKSVFYGFPFTLFAHETYAATDWLTAVRSYWTSYDSGLISPYASYKLHCFLLINDSSLYILPPKQWFPGIKYNMSLTAPDSYNCKTHQL